MTNRIWTGAFTTIIGFATVAITAQTPARATDQHSER